MKAIDFHTHAFPDELAARAIATLQKAAAWQAVDDGTIAALLRSMDAAGIDLSVVCPIATKPRQEEGILAWCNGIRSRRIEPFPSVHPRADDPARWVRLFAQQGYRGIKLHPMYQGFAADEPLMDPLYSTAADESLAVMLHCGKDIAFPPEDDRASPSRLRRVADRFPSLKLVCTHLGGWNDWDEVQRHLLGTAVYMETSFSIKRLGLERAAAMIRNHDPRRVMLGSDWPWTAQSDELALLSQLGLPPQQQEAIRWRNAAVLLGLKAD